MGSTDCEIGIWCDTSSGTYMEVGVGYYSLPDDCTRRRCTTIDSQLVDEMGFPATNHLFGMSFDPITFQIVWGPKPDEVAQYTTSGSGADTCEWACSRGGFYREVAVLPSGAKQYRCLKANRGYYSLPMNNELATWSDEPLALEALAL